MLQDHFYQITIILFLAAVFGAVGHKFRQPLIISFLLAGILVGPAGLHVIEGPDQIELLAHIGISLLLFVVGLRLDIGMIRTVGPVALATGIGQVLFTSLVGFLIALGFEMSVMAAAYVAVALTFSSTIIIVKLLSDKKEIDALHGRIAVGFLIVQDIVAILALIALTALGGDTAGEVGFLRQILWLVGKAAVFIISLLALMRWILPPTLAYLARSQELLVLFAITWAVLMATIAEQFGFTKEVGAFLAGMSLASTEQRDSIGARLIVLRDFLLLFFFIDLGARLELSALGAEVGKAAVFSLFVLIGNPLIVMIIMAFMGYRKRTGFLCGLTVAQISEFSLILAALGLSLGHIDNQAMNLITLVGLVTICVSTYMILHSGSLYDFLAPVLRVFERNHPYRETTENSAAIGDLTNPLIILLGLGNYGSAIATQLKRRGREILAVDFDPESLKRGRRMGLRVLYGDVSDPETLTQLPLHSAGWVVSTVRNQAMNFALLHGLKAGGFGGRVAVAAGSEPEVEPLRALGAHVVLQPFSDAAEQAAEELTGAVHALPGLVDWPASLQEISLRPGSVFAGKKLADIPLRQETGVSVLVVSRAGQSYFNPGPDFQLFPGDRLVLLGDPQNVLRAVEYLDQRHTEQTPAEENTFAAGDVVIAPDSPRVGKSLAELAFRHQYGVTVIGIRRGKTRITSPSGNDCIAPEDHLIVVGSREAVEKLQAISPL